MEEAAGRVIASAGPVHGEAVPVLKPEVVEELLARLGRGEPVQRLALEYGVDRKTVRAWRARGGYQPRAPRPRTSILDPHAAWLTARAPEVDFNSAVLYRELVTHFRYAGSAQQVLRFVRPLRLAARRPRATIRFETPPGQQAQVDFGQRRVWIAEQAVTAHVFVCTLGYSRRIYAEAFDHERLDAVLAGHEHAFQHFGGVPAQLVVDNAKPAVLSRGGIGWCGIPPTPTLPGSMGSRPGPTGPTGPRLRGRPSPG